MFEFKEQSPYFSVSCPLSWLLSLNVPARQVFFNYVFSGDRDFYHYARNFVLQGHVTSRFSRSNMFEKEPALNYNKKGFTCSYIKFRHRVIFFENSNIWISVTKSKLKLDFPLSGVKFTENSLCLTCFSPSSRKISFDL